MIKFNILQSRIYFKPFNSNNDTGIRIHNKISAIFLKILCFFSITKGITTITIGNKSIYLNRGSFIKWKKIHEKKSSGNDKVSDAIAGIISAEKSQRNKLRKDKFETQSKIIVIAEKHFKRLVSMCYDHDKRLKAELAKTTNLGKSFIEEDFLFSKSKLQIEDYTINECDFVYHGTSPKNARKIRQHNFDPFYPTSTGSDSGAFGSYFALNKNEALGYAKNKDKGLITCKIKHQLKIAQLTEQLIDKTILLNLTSQGYLDTYRCEIENELKNNNVNNSMDFEEYFKMYFFRDFFMRLGYRGFYKKDSKVAECSYICLFDPKEDIELV